MAIATLTVIGLMMARQSQRAADVQRNLRALGATRPQVASWTAAPALLAVAGDASRYVALPVGGLFCVVGIVANLIDPQRNELETAQ